MINLTPDSIGERFKTKIGKIVECTDYMPDEAYPFGFNDGMVRNSQGECRGTHFFENDLSFPIKSKPSPLCGSNVGHSLPAPPERGEAT